MKIGIVNYSIGNVGSVYSAFKFFKYDVSIIDNPCELDNIDIIVLAGVGNFNTASEKLKEYNFFDELNKQVLINKKPILGICLGMQLFAQSSDEDGKNDGFGWIDGHVKKIETSLKLPNIGWNDLIHSGNHLFNDIEDNYFYFMHSYHFVPRNTNVILSTTKYGDIDFVSTVRKDNIVGVQFHPEKSQGNGLKFLRNFVEEFT